MAVMNVTILLLLGMNKSVNNLVILALITRPFFLPE